MSSMLRPMIRSLRRDLFAHHYQKVFTAARRRHHVFASHNTIASVLAVLRDDHSKTYPERETLTRALIAEQQRNASPFWSSALLTAYYPMLSRLRHRIYGYAFPDADLDQMVISTFLFVVEEIPLDEKNDRIAMWLRQQTQRRVFRMLREQQKYERFIGSDNAAELPIGDEPAWPETTDNSCIEPTNPKDAAESVTALLAYAGNVVDAECFDLMTASLICGRRISTYIYQWLPKMTKTERKRCYQRIKRRHSRALARLREEILLLYCPRNSQKGFISTEESNELLR